MREEILSGFLEGTGKAGGFVKGPYAALPLIPCHRGEPVSGPCLPGFMKDHTMTNIILIGYRGTGKTAVGKALARKIGYVFLDTDDIVEKRAGRTIEAIVGEKGWPRFRVLEREVLEGLAGAERTVIATGGGIPEDPGNRKILAALGRVIWLTAAMEEMVRRIQTDGTTETRRPPLETADLPSEIETVLGRRIPCYEAAADWMVDTTGKSVETVADEILKKLEGGRYGR